MYTGTFSKSEKQKAKKRKLPSIKENSFQIVGKEGKSIVKLTNHVDAKCKALLELHIVFATLRSRDIKIHFYLWSCVRQECSFTCLHTSHKYFCRIKIEVANMNLFFSKFLEFSTIEKNK